MSLMWGCHKCCRHIKIVLRTIRAVCYCLVAKSCPTRHLCPWDFPGKNTGVGCHFLLQGIFLTQGLNPCLLPCSQVLYHLSHQGSLYWSCCVCVSCSVMSDSATPRTVTQEAPVSMEFSRQEYWCGLPFPSPGDLPNPGIKPQSPALQADSLPSEPPGKPILELLAHYKYSSIVTDVSCYFSPIWFLCIWAWKQPQCMGSRITHTAMYAGLHEPMAGLLISVCIQKKITTCSHPITPLYLPSQCILASNLDLLIRFSSSSEIFSQFRP